MNKNKEQIIKLVSLAMLTALVIVLQALASNIKFGIYSPALCLIPIAIGAILFGPLAGTFLGLVFGVVVLMDFAGVAPFYAVSVPGTVITVLAKGGLAGLASGWIFKVLKEKNTFIGIILASIAVPLVNSILFRVGFVTFFYDMLGEEAKSSAGSTFVYLFLGLTGVNFALEIGLSAVLAPTIARICEIVSKQLNLNVINLGKKKTNETIESTVETSTENSSIENYNF